MSSECKSPSTFGSFNGKPASNISKLFVWNLILFGYLFYVFGIWCKLWCINSFNFWLIDDCFWDFVACKRENSMGSSTIFRKGRMISRRNQNGRNQSCCQNRYHSCCEYVTGYTTPASPTFKPTTPRPTPATTKPRSLCPKTTPSNLSKFWES